MDDVKNKIRNGIAFSASPTNFPSANISTDAQSAWVKDTWTKL